VTPRWRSLLFVASDDRVRLQKIAERGADAVILDLEDAVLPERKPAARDGLAEVIAALAENSCLIVVRINSAWRDVYADLAVAVCAGVAAIMVPKVENSGRLAVIAEMVAEFAQTAGVPVPGLIALVESPAGLAAIDAIADVDSVIGLALGSEDFSLSLGVSPSAEALDLPCRVMALAAARRGLIALGLPISIATIDDQVAWQAAVRTARAIGLTGALCIHPRQIAAVNQGFAWSAAEIAAAARVVAAWDAAGGAGVIQLDGRMVDLLVVLAARRTLAGRLPG
jgi:citrate lyase subunit beta/citryl-CoA lyase